MGYACEDIIRTRMTELSGMFDANGISVKESMIRDYLIKYEIFYRGERKGILQVFYKPSKSTFKLTAEKLDEEVFMLAKKIFENPIKPVDSETQQNENAYSELTGYYDILKKYRNKNFDFSCFGEVLLKHHKDESARKCIAENSDKFDVLEKYYLMLVNEKQVHK